MDNLARPDAEADFGQLFVDAVLADGSAAVIKPLAAFISEDLDTPHLRATAKGHRSALVADITHFANILHGRHPGVVDHAAHKIVDDAARKWLIGAIDGFASERRFLNALTVAAGPVHRQSGQEKIAGLITHQSRNFEMLATSDRTGTPAGAAIAFVIDWIQTRHLLDKAALCVGMQPPLCNLPSVEHCQDVAFHLGTTTSAQRAMSFGSEQLLAQQRGLWQLVEARHIELMAG